jgi:hypothetical protein
MEPVQGSKGSIFKSSRPGYPRGAAAPVSIDEVQGTAQAWADAGITDVFVLLTDGEQLFYYESKLECLYHPFLSTHNFPIADMKPMRLSMALVLAEKAYHILRGPTAGRKILVHCSAGIGRTNMVLGCISWYLTYKQVFRRLGFSAPQTPQQALLVQEFKNHILKEAYRSKKIVEV